MTGLRGPTVPSWVDLLMIVLAKFGFRKHDRFVMLNRPLFKPGSMPDIN